MSVMPWVLMAIASALILTLILLAFERARDRDRQAIARYAMISKVSAALAEILRADTTIEEVLRLLVPEFADWCALHLVEEGGIRRAIDAELQWRSHKAEIVFADIEPGAERPVRIRIHIRHEQLGERAAIQHEPVALAVAVAQQRHDETAAAVEPVVERPLPPSHDPVLERGVRIFQRRH